MRSVLVIGRRKEVADMVSREREIERKLVTNIRFRGGECLKLISSGNAGVPDRLILMPNGVTVFVELKAMDGVVEPRQNYWHKRLRALGYPCYVVRTEEDIWLLLQEVIR